MSKFLIHIHSGPDLKNKSTLGMLVAITAFNKGNEVNIFLAADGVHLLNIKNEGEVVGQGTGDLKNHLDKLKQNNIKLYVSGMSAKARGYDESLLNGFNAEFAMPDKLLTLSTESDSVLCY
jgi:predicted peroxiredoxin